MEDTKTLALTASPRHLLGWGGFGVLFALLALALIAARDQAEANHALQGLVLALLN